jgi:hypothetical protein
MVAEIVMTPVDANERHGRWLAQAVKFSFSVKSLDYRWLCLYIENIIRFEFEMVQCDRQKWRMNMTV